MNGYLRSSPHFFRLIKRAFTAAVVGLLVLAFFVPAPLEEAADFSRVPNPSRSAWFLLWMQELVSYSSTLVYLIVAMALFFAALPWLAGRPVAAARWFAGDQRWINLAALVAFIWIMVRLSLALPITVAEKRLAIIDSWKVTRGHAWGLVGMTIQAFILSMVVSLLGWIIFMPLMFLMGGGLSDLEGASLEGAPPMELLSALGPMAIVAAIWLALISALQLAIMYAPYAAAYRDIRGGGVTPGTAAPEAAGDPAI